MVNASLIGKWFGVALGVVISGESLALFIGIYFIAENKSKWTNYKNLLFLILDFITGILLIVNTVSKRLNNNIFLYVILAIIIASHMFREIEYFFPLKNLEKFCLNLALFIVNNFKLLLPVVLFFIRPF